MYYSRSLFLFVVNNMSTPSRLPTDPTSRSDKARKPISRAEKTWLFVILGLGVFIACMLLTQINLDDPRNSAAAKSEKSDVDEWPRTHDYKSLSKSE